MKWCDGGLLNLKINYNSFTFLRNDLLISYFDIFIFKFVSGSIIIIIKKFTSWIKIIPILSNRRFKRRKQLQSLKIFLILITPVIIIIITFFSHSKFFSKLMYFWVFLEISFYPSFCTDSKMGLAMFKIQTFTFFHIYLIFIV